KEARKYFHAAEDSFTHKKYSDAILLYRNAIQTYPDFYQASIYLGDCYWYKGNMDSAEYYFRKGIARCPDLLEPRKYLVDALAFRKKNEEAKTACIAAICIYPDISMFMKYRDLVKRDGKKFSDHWMSRKFDLNTCEKQDELKEKYWKTYRKAKEDVSAYCGKDGILAANSITKQKYLEVYCWEKMLNSEQEVPEEFAFARKMMEAGYLDCYVFISLFHQDVYTQFADFAKHNQSRVGEYFQKYLTE
ncbi:MAG TPA: tetratricopeptide repeat protein, partial [Bacteroidia bacterium]|nr:tetratricopeptide repeat protein [Bacteroidia bacterium]